MIGRSGLGALYGLVAARVDPELRGIRAIVASASKAAHGRSHESCDAVFAERLRTNPFALKMSFWADHFEWKFALACPDLTPRILDFGCGSGHSDILLARNGKQVHGIDISPLGIRIANYLRGREPEDVRSRLSFEAADISVAGPSGMPFDSVWASHVFEHILHPGPVLDDLRRWVAPHATLLVSVPLGRAYDDPGHVHHFATEEDLRGHMARHIDVVTVTVSHEHSVIRAVCRFP